MIQNKIACLESIAIMIKSKNSVQIIKNSFNSFITIINTKQEHHLGFLLYFFIYKINPFKK